MDPNMVIRDIMVTNLLYVHPGDDLSHIRTIFQNHDFHHLPVVESGEKLVGIISKTDYLGIAAVLQPDSKTEAPSTGDRLSGIHAADIMTRYPLCLEPQDTLGLAADIFLANKFHALPVVEDGQLVGIITTHDLLKSCFEMAVENSNHLPYQE